MDLPVPLYAFVIEEELRRAKNDSLFWQVTLKIKEGTVKGFMWGADSDAAESLKYPHIGDIVELTDFKDQMEERKSIIINSFTRLPEEALPEDFKEILEFEKASNEDIAWAKDIIHDESGFEEKKHFKFTMKCLDAIGLDKFYNCPAATQVHHQFQGGLLVHTAEVVELACAVAQISIQRYPFINLDVVRSAAILHDVGKVDTYFFNKVGAAQMLITEKIIGHLFYGMFSVAEVAKKTKVDQQFVDEVLHCIASHHGDPLYGSLKTVQSIEAGIVSRIDYISSRNGMLAKEVEDVMSSEQPMKDSFVVYKEPYFRSLGMEEYLKGE
jgi:3'-5' exoribonuclease